MIYTCDNCHYTFESQAQPLSCPDCGKKAINRRIGSKVLSTPAVREATDEECAWYESIQTELQTEDTLNDLRNEMTIDEYNWSLIMQFEHQPKTEEARASTAFYLSSLRQDPDRAAEVYPTIRRLFTSKITRERAIMKDDNLEEPGPALRTLFSFKQDKDIPDFLLGPPNLGNVRRIDLEKIAREPSAAYTQFLLDLEKSFTN